jgi:hypothetical protein
MASRIQPRQLEDLPLVNRRRTRLQTQTPIYRSETLKYELVVNKEGRLSPFIDRSLFTDLFRSKPLNRPMTPRHLWNQDLVHRLLPKS